MTPNFLKTSISLSQRVFTAILNMRFYSIVSLNVTGLWHVSNVSSLKYMKWKYALLWFRDRGLTFGGCFYCDTPERKLFGVRCCWRNFLLPVWQRLLPVLLIGLSTCAHKSKLFTPYLTFINVRLYSIVEGTQLANRSRVCMVASQLIWMLADWRRYKT